MIRLVFILLLLLLAVLVLSWFHVLPGGWFLRNLIEDPGAREARLQAEHEAERQLEFTEEEPKILALGSPIVFFGSSTVERFPVAASFPAVEVVNRGIGGEATSHLLTRMDASLPSEVWPRVKGVLLYVGSIDLRILRVTTAELMIRVEKVVRCAQKLAPQAPIMLLGYVPGRSAEPRSSGEVFREANVALKQLRDRNRRRVP